MKLVHKNTKREPWIFLGRKTKVSKKPLILYLKILRLKIKNIKSQLNALVDLRTRKNSLWWSGVAALHIHPNLLSDCSALEELGVFCCSGLIVLKQVYFPKEKWQEIQAYLTGIRETDSRIRLIVKGGSAGTPLSLIFEFGNNLKYQQKQLQFQLLHYLLYNALESWKFTGLFLCSMINFMNTFLSLHHVFPLRTTKTSAFRLPKESSTCSF